MKLLATTSALALTVGLAAAPLWAQDSGLETIIVTALRRSENLQTAPVAITALSGASMQSNRILTMEDLGRSVTGVNFTATSPQAQEINIRGVTNTRLTAPTADQSVSTFLDDVYVGRSGTMNASFFDLERVEVIRGPQGVLLGKNVAGGAINVISAPAQFENSGRITGTIGNYSLHQGEGYVTGGLTEALAARLSFQVIDRGGYAKDLQHGVDLEDLQSTQVRGTLRYEPADTGFRANLIVSFSREDSNGPNRVPVHSPNNLPGPNLDPWTQARNQIISRFYPKLNVRESYPTWPTFAGESSPTPQETFRRSWSEVLKLEKDISDITLTSITGYRQGRANTFYDQSGIGPTNPYGVTVAALFAEPVYFQEKIFQFSEEVRASSNYGADSRVDWILGGFYLRSHVTQFNRYWGESLGLPTLSGQSNWYDPGTTKSYAGFGQLGFKITPELKITGGIRYTRDEKNGTQTGVAVSRAGRFDPTDTASLTPLALPVGTNSFTAPYGKNWSKATPQGTISYTPNEDLMVYGTISVGFKGGGFQNSAPNAFAASTPYNPESVTNYEAGYKWELLDKTLRWNSAAFYMKYRDLQVQQTSGACLCNIINNASSATIKGFETEVQYSPMSWLQLAGALSYVSPKYAQFVDTNGQNNTGNILQRTPQWQYSLSGDVSMSVLGLPDALHLRLAYKHQSRMPWSPDNFNWEPGFGLLDGRVSFSPQDKPWAISFWARNITNKLYRTSIIPIFGAEISSYGAPQTWGADLSIKF